MSHPNNKPMLTFAVINKGDKQFIHLGNGSQITFDREVAERVARSLNESMRPEYKDYEVVTVLIGVN